MAIWRSGCTAGLGAPITSGPNERHTPARSSTTTTNPQNAAAAALGDSTSSTMQPGASPTGSKRWNAWRTREVSRRRRRGSPNTASTSAEVASSVGVVITT